jgi:hypothetical protein
LEGPASPKGFGEGSARAADGSEKQRPQYTCLAKNPRQFIPLTRGKIAIGIEYAAIWFRRIEVKAI